ncbi:MAG: hypothetical protein EOL87_11330, partial [Spartobacteria bacterium]|nr:hypothetical protein [Spartobacteria bacterium]
MKAQHRYFSTFLWIALGVLFSACGSYADQSFTVTNGADSGAGSLRWAMTEPCEGTRTVNFSIYNTVIELSSPLVVTGDTAIIAADHGSNAGFGEGSRLTVSGGGLMQPFIVPSNAALRLQSLTVANGYATNGGAIFNDGGYLRVVRCTLLSNSATYGGAVYSRNATSVLNTCTFSGNTATRGGVAYNEDGYVRLQYVTACDNSASELGGVLYTDGGSNIVHRSILWSNDAPACSTPPAYSTQIADANSATVSVTQCIIEGGYPGYYDSTGLVLYANTTDWHFMPTNLDVNPVLGPLGYPRYSGQEFTYQGAWTRSNSVPCSTMMYEPLPGSPAHWAIYGIYKNADWLADVDDVREQRGGWLRRSATEDITASAIGAGFIGFYYAYMLGGPDYTTPGTNYWGELMWDKNTQQTTDVLTPFEPITLTVTANMSPPISYEGGKVYFLIPEAVNGPSCTIEPNPATIAADGTVTFTPIANHYVGTHSFIAYYNYNPPHFGYAADKVITLSNGGGHHLVVTNGAGDTRTGSLRWALANAADDGVITFDKDYTITLPIRVDVRCSMDGGTNRIVIRGNGNELMTVGNNGTQTIQNITIADGNMNYYLSTMAAGVTLVGGDITFKNVIFRNNRGYRGGALSYQAHNCLDDALNLKLINCLFEGNSAIAKGGALYTEFTDVEMDAINCTFVGNSAEQGGVCYNATPGILCGLKQRYINCIFRDNTATTNPVIYTEAENSSITFSNSNIQGAFLSGSWDASLGIDGGGNIAADPLFADAANSNYCLLAASPCINAGVNSAVPANATNDLAGNTRIVDGTVDMGAYEAQQVVLPVTFHANGGTPATTTNRYFEGLAFGSLPQVTRADYIFAVWTNGAGTTVATNMTVSGALADLYAKWVFNYYVAYDANGAAGVTADSVYTYDTPGTLKANAFTDDTYRFIGWNTLADGSGTAYADGATILNLTNVTGATVTLYAQWADSDLVTVTNHLDGFVVEPVWVYESLMEFPTNAGQPSFVSGPSSGLIEDDEGMLYGTAAYGGAQGLGSVFRFDPADPLSFTNLHSFNIDEGSMPWAGLAAPGDGWLYGSTFSSTGSYGKLGTLYRVRADDGDFESLHEFTYNATTSSTWWAPYEGSGPGVPLTVCSSGELFGATSGQGAFFGTLFKLGTNGDFTLMDRCIASWGGPLYAMACGLTLSEDGWLYTLGSQSTDFSSILRLRMDAATYPTNDLLMRSETVYTFNGHGSSPGSAVFGSDGALYGALRGGYLMPDVLYRLDVSNTPATSTFVYQFPEGETPLGGLVVGPENDLFGISMGTATPKTWSVYRLRITNSPVTFEKILTRTMTNGEVANGNLLYGSDGALYGVSTRQDDPGGTIFRLTTELRTNAMSGTLRWALSQPYDTLQTIGFGFADQTIELTSPLVISGAVEIVGVDHGNEDGSLPDGFRITVSGGDAVRPFILTPGASLRLESLTVSDGAADEGGAIYNDGGDLRVVRCALLDNTATRGGAVYSKNASSVLNSCTLSGNSAERGGTLYNENSYARLQYVTASENSASELGGVIYADGGTQIVHRSILWDNPAPVCATPPCSSQIADTNSATISVTQTIIEDGYPGVYYTAALEYATVEQTNVLTGNLNVDPLLGALGYPPFEDGALPTDVQVSTKAYDLLPGSPATRAVYGAYTASDPLADKDDRWDQRGASDRVGQMYYASLGSLFRRNADPFQFGALYDNNFYAAQWRDYTKTYTNVFGEPMWQSNTVQSATIFTAFEPITFTVSAKVEPPATYAGGQVYFKTPQVTNGPSCVIVPNPATIAADGTVTVTPVANGFISSTPGQSESYTVTAHARYHAYPSGWDELDIHLDLRNTPAAQLVVTNDSSGYVPGSLSWALNNVSDGGEITFDRDYMIIVTNPVTVRCSINGGTNRVVFSGNDKAQVMNVVARPGMVIRNVTIADGFQPNLDGLYTDSAGAQMSAGSASAADVRFINVIFRGNLSDFGGALGFRGFDADHSLHLSLVNCVFDGNYARIRGGAIYSEATDARVDMINCTFAGNFAGQAGGAIYNESAGIDDGLQQNFVNCIFRDNISGNYPVIHTAASSWIDASLNENIFSNCNVQTAYSSGSWDPSLGTDGGGNVEVDPLFVDAAGADGIVGSEDDDLRLRSISSNIDAGNNGAVPGDITQDVAGHDRFTQCPYGTNTGVGTPPIVDMGAYEYFNSAPVLTTNTFALTAIDENTFDSEGDRIADLTGMAVIAVESDHGQWQYALDGTNWNAIGAVSATNALLLAADDSTRLRFVPNLYYNGEPAVTFRAWDGTWGSNGELVDIGATGGMTAFSTNTAEAVITVTPVNQAPEITSMTNQTVNESQSTPAIAFILSDVDHAVDTLLLVGEASNTNLVPATNIVFGGSGSNRTVTVTPATYQSGSAWISVTVFDGSLSATSRFVLTVNPVNNAPTVAPIGDQSVLEGHSTDPIAFTVSDVDTPVSNLLASGSSANPILVPNTAGSIVCGGSGSNRTITVTPVSGWFGDAIINVTVSDGQLYNSTSFKLTVIPVNTPPEIGYIPNLSVDQDQSTAPQVFGVYDRETPAGSLTLSGSCDNTNLLPVANIVFGGSGNARTIVVTPAPGQYGSGEVTVTVSDGELTANYRFTLTVNAVNQAPVVSEFPDLAIPMNGSSGTIPFTISDNETAASELTLFKNCDNAALIPYSGMVFGGSGGNRTLTITPTAGQSGTGLVTVSVSDGKRMTPRLFTVTVNAVNQAPRIGFIAHQTAIENGTTKAISIYVEDPDTPLSALTLSGTSDNTNLVSAGCFAFSGTEKQRTAIITPAPHQYGSATVTVTVTDGELTAASSFILTVTPVNTAPTVSAISTQSMTQGDAPLTVPFVVGDREQEPGALQLFVTSGNPSLLPLSGVAFGGSGSNRTVTLAPATNVSGSAAVTIWVYDGFVSTPSAFTLTVVPVNQAPGITEIADQVIAEDASSGGIAFLIGDRETPATELLLSADSDNPSLIPAENILFGGSPYDRRVTVVPALHQSGTATVSVIVSDGALSNSTSFTVTVTPVNDAPEISAIADQTINQNGATAALPFTVGDVETDATNLVVTALSSDDALVPGTNIVLAGSGTNRTITVTAAAQQYGATTIAIWASDGDLSTAMRFNLTVNQVNQAPTISAIANQTITQETATAAIPFTVGDYESDPDSLTLSASSDNPSLTPSSSFAFGGSGSNRTITVTPAHLRNGTADITVTVSDGDKTASTNFELIVTAVDFAPVVTSFTHPETSVGSDVTIYQFEAWDDDGVSGYMVTSTDEPPAYDNPGWSNTPPESFTVPGIGVYTLYPWAKDGSGNVSAPYGVVYDVSVVNNILYAVPGGLTNGPCDSWATAGDLHYVRNWLSDPGYEIWVKAGTYTPRDGDGNLTRNATFLMIYGALYGGFNGTETNRNQRDPQANLTVLSGDLNGDDGADFANRTDNALHVLTLSDGTVDGFTISGGQADGIDSESIGGGVYNSGIGNPTLNNVTLTDNFAVDGGGLYTVEDAAITLTDVTFSGNRAADNGGGMAVGSDASPLLRRVTFSDNEGGASGGMMANNGFGSAVNLINVTFSGNSATNTGSDVRAGGGLLAKSSAIVYLTNCTFSGNSATSTAFIAAGGIASDMGTVNIGNTIVAGNTSATANPDISGPGFQSLGHNLIGLDDDEIGGLEPGANGDLIGTNGVPIDARLAPLADNGGLTHTMALLTNSPARDAGDDALAPPADQRGVSRPQGSHCDIGAFELDYAALTVTTSTNPVPYGQNLIITAHVTPAAATGTITFTEGETTLASNVALSGGTASFTSAVFSIGSHAIVATYAGAASVVGGASAPYTQQVVKGAQSIGAITFTPSTLALNGTTTVAAVSSSGLPVQFVSLTPDICSVTGTNVTGLASGTGVIAADQAGNTQYNPALRVTTNITVGKGVATVTLTNLTQVYSGSQCPVSATTVPAGKLVRFTYAGIGGTTYGPSSLAPIGAGMYAVTGTVSDSAYEGSATATLTVSRAGASITLGNLSQKYDGTPKRPTFTTTPGGLAVVFTYNGSTNAPSAAGVYAVTGTVNDANYTGATNGTMTISAALATITLGSLTHIYDGAPKNATAETYPADLNVTFIYDGATNRPVNAGGYSVFATATNADYAAAAGDALVIEKTAQTITFAALDDIFWTNTLPLSATSDSGLPVAFEKVSGPVIVQNSNAYFTGIGTVSIRATQSGDSNNLAATSVTRTFTALGPRLVLLGTNQLTFTATYNGTNPAPQTLTLTNSGSAACVFSNVSSAAWLTLFPTNGSLSANAAMILTGRVDTAGLDVGTYRATNTITAPDIIGSPITITVELTVDKASQTITFPNPGEQITTNVTALSASSTSGGAVTFEVVSGAADLTDQTNLTYRSSGAVVIRASQAGNLNYAAAPVVTQTFQVVRAVQQALNFAPASPQTYNTTRGLSATGGSGTGAVTLAVLSGPGTLASGTNLTMTSGTGTVTLTATKAQDDLYFVQTVTGTVAAAKAAQSITGFNPTNGAAFITTQTTGLAASASSGLPVSFAIFSGPGALTDGTNLTFSGAGTVLVTATQSGSENYTAALTLTNSLIVSKAAQTITFPPVGTQIITNTLTLSATASSGLAVTFERISGPATLVDATMTFSATGEVVVAAHQAGDTLWEAATSATNTFNVVAQSAQINLSGLSKTYNGAPQSATVTTVPTGLTYAVTYDGVPSIPVNAGSYSVTAVITDPAYAGQTTGLLTIARAAQSITSFTPTNGTPLTATQTVQLAAQASSGLPVTFAVTNGPATLTDGTNLTFTGAGTVQIVAQQAGNGNYQAAPSLTNSLVVTKATQTITFPPVGTQIITNTLTLSATASSGLAVTFEKISGPATLLGSTMTFSATGEVVVAARQVGDTLWEAATSATNTFNVVAQSAQINLSGLSKTYTGSAQGATVTTVPTGLTCSVTYDGLTNLPVNAGDYSVAAVITDPAYAGTTTGLLSIVRAAQAITAFTPTNGTPLFATQMTQLTAQASSGLPVSFAIFSGPGTLTDGTNLTFSGEGTVQIVAQQAGDGNHQAAPSLTNSLIVSKAAQTITFPPVGTQIITNTLTLSATASSGLPVTYEKISGPATLVDATMTFSATGEVVVAAHQAGNALWEAATSATNTFNVVAQSAQINLDSLSKTYNGAPQGATVTTIPTGLTYSVTYDGVTNLPVNAGDYSVAAVITDPAYA